MPPKTQTKKTELEDFSDVKELPPAKVFKFSLIMKSFLSQESRDKVTKRVTDNLVATSQDKIKILTREEIVNYGKAKGLIIDSVAM